MTAILDIKTHNNSSFIDALKASNREKKHDAPLGIIIHAADDPNGSLSSPTWHWSFLEIAKTHRIALEIIEKGSEISTILHNLGARGSLVIMHGHGTRNGDSIAFGKGEEGLYSSSDITAESYSSLPLNTPIILTSCFSGLKIAGILAQISERKVFGVTQKSFAGNHYIKETEAGWQLTCFNDSDSQFIQFFDKNSSASSLKPCSPSLNTDDFRNMVNYIITRAEAGDRDAQSYLGSLYQDQKIPQPADKNRTEVAFEWFQKAARQGDRIAQCNLGCFYINKKVASPPGKDRLEIAVEWFKKAADQGERTAQHHLGVLYETGKIQPPNSRNYIDTAAELYYQAACAGNGLAQHKLASLYETKQISPPKELTHLKAALYWYKEASDRGIKKAQESLYRIDISTGKRKTPEDESLPIAL